MAQRRQRPRGGTDREEAVRGACSGLTQDTEGTHISHTYEEDGKVGNTGASRYVATHKKFTYRGEEDDGQEVANGLHVCGSLLGGHVAL